MDIVEVPDYYIVDGISYAEMVTFTVVLVLATVAIIAGIYYYVRRPKLNFLARNRTENDQVRFNRSDVSF